MAVIVKNDEQLQALEFIDAAITEVKLLNAVLSGEEENFRISWTAGRKGNAVDIDRKFAKNIIGVLRDQRKLRVKEINAKLQRFKMIQLSDEEKAIIGESALEKKSDDGPSEPIEEAASEPSEAQQDDAYDVEFPDDLMALSDFS